MCPWPLNMPLCPPPHPPASPPPPGALGAVGAWPKPVTPRRFGKYLYLWKGRNTIWHFGKYCTICKIENVRNEGKIRRENNLILWSKLILFFWNSREKKKEQQLQQVWWIKWMHYLILTLQKWIKQMFRRARCIELGSCRNRGGKYILSSISISLQRWQNTIHYNYYSSIISFTIPVCLSSFLPYLLILNQKQSSNQPGPITHYISYIV